jgi:arylsulfatase A-like enzyme
MTTGRTTRRRFLKALGMGAAALTVPSRLAGAEKPPRPNIILMMVDDMGYSDIGCYGSEIRTPNLDRLAASGLRFTQFYNTARCCPTRATLMTGLYAHQAGVGHMMSDRGVDGYRGDLNKTCVTIPEVLAPAGYGTYMCGKWHVTRFTGPAGPKHNWPRQRGYDRFFGTIMGGGSYWAPAGLTEENTQIQAPTGFYYSDAISDHAVTFITDHTRKRPDDPFFIYVAYTAPHWPLHAPDEDIARYRGKYMNGWDAIRSARHARMIEMGLVRKAWALTPRDTAATAWEEVDEEKKQEMDLRMSVYAAQIDRVDQGVGRIVETLNKLGRLRNTLFLFLADNGGCAEGGPWGFERKKGGRLGTDKSFASYGLSWANASNTPFRRYKHWVHEGGIATPLIVHWPERIKAKGELRRQPAHLIDIMTTCVEVAGATYPAEYKGNRITPMEGRSLLPAFDDKPIQRQAIFWEHEGNRAVRIGKWKLVAKGRSGPWELYDLHADRTELNDLAATNNERVKQMADVWQKWAERAHVVPYAQAGRKPKKKKKEKK